MEAVLRMAFTGRHERLSAQRAYELGICSQVVDPPEQLAAEAQALGELIARNSPPRSRTPSAHCGARWNGSADERAAWGRDRTAIVSYIEPHPGHAVDFNRWYERDHFPATVTGGPGVFAGARFVASRACKALRPPGASSATRRAAPTSRSRGCCRQAGRVGRVGRPGDADDRRTGSALPVPRPVHTAVYRGVGPADAVDAVVALDRGHGGVVVIADEGPKLAVHTGEVRPRSSS